MILARRLLFALSLVALLAGSLSAQNVPENIRQLMQDRNYAEAVKAIDAVPDDADVAHDYLAYLKGRALHLQNEHDAAIAVFDGLAQDHANSAWARRARFAKAVALLRKGDYRAAERIYRAEAEYLLSLDRKQQVADIYLEFADVYFEPPKDEKKPDYEKALKFYTQALDVGPQVDSRVQIELRIAQCFQKLDKFDEAIGRYRAFIEDHPDAEQVIESRYLLGQSLAAKDNPAEARRTWQDLLALHGASKSPRLADAALGIAATYGVPSPENDESLDLGIAALRRYLKQFPDHERVSQAHLHVAQSFMHRGRHEDAVATLTTFIADPKFAESEQLAVARNLLGQALRLQQKYDEALAAWRDYLTKHPAHQDWAAVQRQIVDTEFETAQQSYKKKQYDAAAQLWTQFMAKYPLDGRSPGILLQLGQMQFDQSKWSGAIDQWRRLVSKYPDSNEASQAQFLVGRTTEQKLGKFEEAIEEYRKVKGPAAGKAQAQIARLTGKSMAIVTERVFRSNETPQLKLTSRNIETLQVRLYTVDMETYFRKMHLAAGVEQLDIALIDPDHSFEFTVPDFEKYRETEVAIDVQLPADAEGNRPSGGVTAVTVSSETLEATTLLVQSDLDLIVKSSRDEIFVFAENMRTGKPWPGARLLISNGDQVFSEQATGDDGVLQKSFKQLKDANDVRVFAVADGHAASSGVPLRGIGAAQGLTPRGYIYTDRPAYRAGQMVHIRGVVRKVAGDTYQVEDGKKYKLAVFDGRNRQIHDGEVTLSKFGAFHQHLVLPAAAVQGEYRVQVVDDNNRESYQGTFAVHQYQLEPVTIGVETERSVYYRGEEIKGKIAIKYYYGAPLVGREVHYVLAGQRTFTAKTDENGEVEFTLPTREFREAQTLPLVVTLPEHNLQTAKTFFLATQGFTIEASTVRPVYLSGETFELEVKTTDAEGEPIAKDLKLSVLHRKGGEGEVTVEQKDLATDADKGTARTTLKLDEGGRYIMRLEGVDRFDNPVTGQLAMRISDDKDTVRLRILADRHTFKVGDTARVRLHWREEPALALITHQGAKILDYQLVELKQGVNELQIPMTAVLAPNFDLAVAVMSDRVAPQKDGETTVVRRFHAASSPFTVQRDLRVTLAVKPTGEAAAPRPGEDVEVTLTTTDPQGNPIAAELSLAMVEQSLLDRFSSPLPSIHDFFLGQRRQSAVRTTSSITFAYRPDTRPINEQLLAEASRVERLAEEARRLNEDGGADHFAFDVPTDDPFGAPADDFDVDDIIETQNDRDAHFPGVVELTDEREMLLDRRSASVARRNWGGQARAAGERSRGLLLGGIGGGGGMAQQQAPATESVTVLSGAANYAGHAYQLGLLPEGAVVDSINGQAIHSFAFQQGGENRAAMPRMNWLYQQHRHELQYVDANGRWGNVNLANELGTQWDVDRAGTLIARLSDAGATLMPQLPPHETGYWNPAVVTDEQGRATLTVTLPERSTAWKLLAKGVTLETLSGEATDALTVKKDLFGQIKLPPALTDGDRAEIGVTVHNDALAEGEITVTLKTTIGESTTQDSKTIQVDGKGIETLAFDAEMKLPEGADRVGAEATFELIVASGERRDVVRRAVPVQPHGMLVFATTGGSADNDTTAVVQPPENMPLAGASLQVLIGATVEQSLLDVLFGAAPRCQIESSRIAAGTETAASDLMAALALQGLLSESREADSPQIQSLDARVRAAVSLLVSSQNDDGGWSWTGRGGGSHRFATARVVWALSLARTAGYRVADETFNGAVGFLQKQLGEAAVADYETKAVLLHALATAGRGDFPLANQLHRNRQTLSAAGLAHLALALAEMKRPQTATEVLTLLATRDLDDAQPQRRAAINSPPWSHSSTELRALYAVALQKVTPGSPELAKLVDWLMAHRTGHRFSPDKATGPAMLALCGWHARGRFESEHYKLTVFVNNLKLSELEIEKDSRTRTLDVPVEMLAADGKQRVRFELTGRGQFTYQCILSGFVPADKLASTTPDWEVQRFIQPAPLELDGQPIPRGFDVLHGSYSSFRNNLTQLPVGRRAQIELHVRRHGINSNTPEEQLEYLVVTEPLPAGATVIEKSIRGGFERYEITPGAITFYVGSRRSVDVIHFDVHGYLPGQYGKVPTLARNAYRPDQIAVAKPQGLTVLAQGGTSGDAYRLTPRELFELGRRHFDRGELETANTHLTELLAKWNVKIEFYREAARMLLDVHLAADRPKDVVRYFEIVIEKHPDLEIPFAKLLKIGDAYDRIGEYERSYLVFRAAVEASFLRESQVAGFLESETEFTRSVDVMTALLRQYPPEGYVASATYALAQRVYAKAPEAAGDEKLREQKVTRVDLIRRALAMLDGFLTAYPNDPAADEASFSLASAMLDLDGYEDAIAACTRYAERYPQSDFLDSYWYIIGYCHYARGEHAEALAMCNKVAEAKRKDRRTGREVDSPNKWRAVYISGQIHHSRGEAADAIEQYRRVEDRFVDARQAIDYFVRKEIALPEVTTVKPGDAAEVELSYRNVAACDVKVYRIDLLKFSLLRRNLGEITKINLAGIRPHHQAAEALGDGKDYGDRTKSLELPLTEEGAYLVVCRGENLHTSGLVLVSPLVVDIQEDATSGRVRTTVRNAVDDRYVPDVHVKVIGGENDEFFAGETDLRGIFVADGVQGVSTVIARAEGNRYAFFRGQQYLGTPPEEEAATSEADPAAPQAPPSAKGQLLEGLEAGNKAIQEKNIKQLDMFYENPVKEGVQNFKF